MTVSNPPRGGTGGGSGQDGVTPHIGGNGNWFIGATDTGIAARGPQGIQGVKGDPGADGTGGTGTVDLSPYPTFEDVPAFGRFDSRAISVTGTYVPLGVVRQPSRLTWLALCWAPGGQVGTATAADHWLFEIGKFLWNDTEEATPVGPFRPIASKRTYSQSVATADPAANVYGERPVLGKAWNLDTAAFDATAAILDRGDVLYGRWTKAGTNGSPTSLSLIDYTYWLDALPIDGNEVPA